MKTKSSESATKHTGYDLSACGGRIRQLRKTYGYTQEGLADLLGIDRSYLSRIEAGTKGCSVDLFIALADVFHTSLDHLILGAAPPGGNAEGRGTCPDWEAGPVGETALTCLIVTGKCPLLSKKPSRFALH